MRRVFCSALAVIVLLAAVTPCRGTDGESIGGDKLVDALREQVRDINNQIAAAERELASVDKPNWLCGCGLMAFLAFLPGAVIWYFADVKPKEDKRNGIMQRIRMLQAEKENLQNQMFLLQTKPRS